MSELTDQVRNLAGHLDGRGLYLPRRLMGQLADHILLLADIIDRRDETIRKQGEMIAVLRAGGSVPPEQ